MYDCMDFIRRLDFQFAKVGKSTSFFGNSVVCSNEYQHRYDMDLKIGKSCRAIFNLPSFVAHENRGNHLPQSKIQIS